MRALNWKERLIKIQEILGLDGVELAPHFGVSKGTVSHWKTRGSQPGIDKLETFYRNHPEFSIKWLLTGEGLPLKTSDQIIIELNQSSLIDDSKLKQEIQKIWGKLQHHEAMINQLRKSKSEPSAEQSTTNTKGVLELPMSKSLTTSKDTD